MKNVNFNEKLPKQKKVYKVLIKIIIPYSAIKIKANLPLIYSVLNPETNSDSPSAKSNGVRFNSAIILIKNININGYIYIIKLI